MHTLVHIHAYLPTPMHACAHPRTPAHNCAHPCTPAHTRKHLCTPVNTRAHLHTPAHTRAHPCHSHTPHTYPLMPADALNLIIRMKLHVNGKSHMKLYINRPNTKKADRRRRKKKEKRKEQESAEAFQRTKNNE